MLLGPGLAAHNQPNRLRRRLDGARTLALTYAAGRFELPVSAVGQPVLGGRRLDPAGVTAIGAAGG